MLQNTQSCLTEPWGSTALVTVKETHLLLKLHSFVDSTFKVWKSFFASTYDNIRPPCLTSNPPSYLCLDHVMLVAMKSATTSDGPLTVALFLRLIISGHDKIQPYNYWSKTSNHISIIIYLLLSLNAALRGFSYSLYHVYNTRTVVL